MATKLRAAKQRAASWRAQVRALLHERNAVEKDVRRIHQLLKRGPRTEDHGLQGNLRCIIDHLSDKILLL